MKSRMSKFLLGACCSLAISAAQAASISLSPSTVNTPPDVFSIDLLINFSDIATSGGAVDITWDPSKLQYNSDFLFDSAFTSRDTSFDVIDFQSTGLLSIGFGTLSSSGISDTTVAGTLGFTSLMVPVDSTIIGLQDSAKWSGFFDAATGAAITVNYTGTTVSAVPLPAALWLMISGLGILGFSSSRKRKL